VLYDVLVVRPFTGFARVNRADGVDLAYRLAAALTRGVHYLVALGQTGRIRWYAANMALGLVIAILVVLGLS
jgi:NADH-quinone oxidoreductase subunit L